MQKTTQELKRKLRDLKRLEINLRFNGDVDSSRGKLVWDDFFSLKSKTKTSSRFDIQAVLKMERWEFKDVLQEYFYNVYFRIYQERGLAATNINDPSLLELLGLPLAATDKDIKNKFRELAKKYHPDVGGDPEEFIRLMDVIDRLKGGS